jgi:hypothetical protein
MDFDVVAGRPLPEERIAAALPDQQEVGAHFGATPSVARSSTSMAGARRSSGHSRAAPSRVAWRVSRRSTSRSRIYQPRMTLVIGARSSRRRRRARARPEAVPFGAVISATTLDAPEPDGARPRTHCDGARGFSAVTALAIGILGYGAMSDAYGSGAGDRLRIALGAPGSRIVRQVVADVRPPPPAIAGMLGSLTITAWLADRTGTRAPAVWCGWLPPGALAAVVLLASVIRSAARCRIHSRSCARSRVVDFHERRLRRTGQHVAGRREPGSVARSPTSGRRYSSPRDSPCACRQGESSVTPPCSSRWAATFAVD